MQRTVIKNLLAIVAVLAFVVGLACKAPDSPASSTSASPYVLVLGTAQDGGLPHLGCYTGNCAAARAEPNRRRLVTSLLLCDPRDGRRWLFDCSPDVSEQMSLARGHPPTRKEDGPRPPLLEGIFLTHAHMGHYGGLLQLGREAYAVKEIDTWVTPRFAEYLTKNGPWSLLVAEKRLVLRELEHGKEVELAPGLAVVPFLVPHRDEFSDTVGFEIRGPERTLVYLPDIDKWEKWDAWEPAGRIEDLLARCDVALIDGCFYADGEIAGRTMKEIPHPFIAESIERFAPMPLARRAHVYFTHLNHTNPAADPESPAAAAVRAAGMHVLAEGERFDL